MTTNFDGIYCIYKFKNMECESYDEARLAKVLKEITAVYLEDHKCITIAKAILEVFDVSIRIPNPCLTKNTKTNEEINKEVDSWGPSA
jgi:hypothetical protein